MHCTKEAHDAARQDPENIRRTWTFWACHDWGFDYLEYWNCPIPGCKGTVCLEGIGPLQPAPQVQAACDNCGQVVPSDQWCSDEDMCIRCAKAEPPWAPSMVTKEGIEKGIGGFDHE